MAAEDKGGAEPWTMEKEKIIKEDGRYLIYYRFKPISADKSPIGRKEGEKK